MTDEREELVMAIMRHPWLPDHDGLYAGLCPECPGRMIPGGHNSPSHAAHLADALLAAGYSKPRTITTAEELDALPNESVVLDARNLSREGLKATNGRTYWRSMGPAKVLTSNEIALPATVLYEPQP